MNDIPKFTVNSQGELNCIAMSENNKGYNLDDAREILGACSLAFADRGYTWISNKSIDEIVNSIRQKKRPEVSILEGLYADLSYLPNNDRGNILGMSKNGGASIWPEVGEKYEKDAPTATNRLYSKLWAKNVLGTVERVCINDFYWYYVSYATTRINFEICNPYNAVTPILALRSAEKYKD